MVKVFMLTVSKHEGATVPPLFADLSKIILGDVDCSHLAIKSHSTDGSPYSVRPQAILYPKTTGDIKHAIAFAREYQIPLTVSGGQTSASGGALSEGILLDMTRYFSHTRTMNTMEHTVIVDAGVRIDDLKEKLASWNMEIPVLQDEHGDATVGGLVATKSATASTFYAGTIREWIEAITVVVDTGEEHHLKDGISPSGRLLGIYQSVFPLLSASGPTLRAARRECSDDATGYSLWNVSIGPRQLIDNLVGSEGTLAIITSVTFRIVQKKKHSLTMLLPVSDATKIESYVDVAKHHRAHRLFIFDDTFRTLTDTFHSGLLQKTLPRSPFTLIISLEGDDLPLLTKEIKALSRALLDTDELELLDEKTASRIMSNSFLTSLFHAYSRGLHMIATAGNGIIIPMPSYNECAQALTTHMELTGKLFTLTGFVGSGHIAITTAFDSQNPGYEKELQTYRENLFHIVETWKGGISAVGGDGLERTAALSHVYNEATRDVFKKVKEAWDPLSIFNPSKKIHISKDYLIQHAVRSLE